MAVMTLPALMFAFSNAKSQEPLQHVDPPMWWTGMHNKELTVFFHGKGIAKLNPSVDYPGVTLKTITSTGNPNCLFVTIEISAKTEPGEISFSFSKGSKEVFRHPYPLLSRKPGSSQRQSFSVADAIYLLMPDRFSNGDTSNDSLKTLKEKARRSNPDGRHGGDIQGIINNLDYLADLGITALWTTPLLEDNMETYSYHTYATTDYFKTDARFGSNADFARLAEECHKRGIKLIMDVIPNHCGSNHWWMKDLPMADWIHQFPEFTRTNYTIATVNDPHASERDRFLNTHGWFDVSMPDINLNNPFVLTYFKQFAIFWIEFAGVDGLRVDTYPYNDRWQVAKWTKAIREEYPLLNITGECWLHNPAEIVYWQSGVKNHDGYDSFLPAVMDFPLNDAFGSAFNEDIQQWDQGMSRFYNVLALDYLYADPYNNLVFLDNHDMERISEKIAGDLDKFKLAVTLLLTTRGIPQIYYGTEIMMDGQKSKGDGDIRKDFPGGWPGDARNAFTARGRSETENEAFLYMRSLLHYRKNNPVLHSGKLTHFVPVNNLYTYFRINEEKTILVCINNSIESVKPEMERYEEILKGRRTGMDVLLQTPVDLTELELQPKQSIIVEITGLPSF